MIPVLVFPAIPVCKNAERVKCLQSHCHKPALKFSGFSDEKLKTESSKWSILVDKTHELMVCVPPKAGCTTWKTLLANNSAKGPLPDGYKVMSFHFGHALADYGILKLHDYSGTEIRDILENYHKVIVVRHPLERVLSGYIDKLQSGSDLAWQKTFGSKILKWTRNGTMTKSEITASRGKGVHFQEFVKFLMFHPQDQQNEHFAPYQHFCRPCDIAYDEIVKLETHDIDSYNIISRRLEARGLKTKANTVSGGAESGRVGGRTMTAYRNLSYQQLDYLVDVYREDMVRFGYTWERKRLGEVVSRCGSGSYNNETICC